MIRIFARSILGLTILAILSQSGTPFAAAQTSTVKWDTPVNLSNTPTSSDHAAIVADPYGYVHVLWSEDIGGPALTAHDVVRVGNSIIYSRWDGKSWTAPNDVLFVPDDSVADFSAVAVDAKGRLHVVWTGLTNIYYSSAPVQFADSAHAWRQPIIVTTNSARSQLESSIGVDQSGNIHIAYATRGEDSGVFHVVSHDGGATWSAPTKLSQPLDQLEVGFSTVKIVSDLAGYLHVIWQTYEKQGFGQAVYYTRSVDEGQTWSTPQQLVYRGPTDFEVGWAYLTTVSQSELHLVYIGNGERPIGRAHRVTLDGGQTWSAPREILTDMEGINGYVVPVVDSAHELHLIIDMRTRDTQIVGLYYAHWNGNDWSPPVPIATQSLIADSAHFMAATTRLGNELFVVWTELSTGEIWLMRGVVQGRLPAPTQAVPNAATPTPQPTPTTIPFVTPIGNGLRVIDHTPPSAANSSSSNSFLPGAGLAVVVIALVIIGRQLHTRRN